MTTYAQPAVMHLRLGAIGIASYDASDVRFNSMTNQGRKLGNGKPLASGEGVAPDEFTRRRNTRRGWVLDPATGQRVPYTG